MSEATATAGLRARWLLLSGNSRGALTGVGTFVSFVDQNRTAPRVQQYSVDFQRELQGRVHDWESYADSHNGDWGPAAMALALDAYGAPGYEVRAYKTRQDALRDAVDAVVHAGGAACALGSGRARHDDRRGLVDGRFLIDLEPEADGVTPGRIVELRPREGFVVPKGVVHRTRAPERSVILMVETASIVPTGS